MDQAVTTPLDLSVDPKRFWATIERSAQIGVGRVGGLARVALTDADRQMRDEFCAWCRAADLSVTVDTVGNIFARRAGRDNALPPVVLGSHLDTQINGGRYDGIVGVSPAMCGTTTQPRQTRCALSSWPRWSIARSARIAK